MPDLITRSDYVTFSYFLACCGARMLHHFPELWDCRPALEIKTLIRSVDKELKKIFNIAPKHFGAFFLAILNEQQNTHLKDVMKKHDFKVIKKKTNPSGGAMLYLYCKSVGQC